MLGPHPDVFHVENKGQSEPSKPPFLIHIHASLTKPRNNYRLHNNLDRPTLMVSYAILHLMLDGRNMVYGS